MSEHERFSYHSIDELKEKVKALGLDIPFSDDFSILASPIQFGTGVVPNRLCCHPMEGCDGLENGAPSPLTYRRYRRFGGGGAGLIWFEATAVLAQGRANPRQLWIHQDTAADFKTLVDQTRQAAFESMGHDPFLVLQLTHSGRYSRPVDKPTPIIAHHSEILDPRHNLPPDYPLISDEEIDQLRHRYVEAARWAREAGFNAVDIKSCHRYLISELLASHTRENSRYGGPYENRVRFLLEVIDSIKKALPGFEVTSRLNVYDAIAYPYGWGVDKNDYQTPDLTEPLQLIGQLQDAGYHGLNITIANPYFNPHYGRPFDRPIIGGYTPSEHPLEGVERMIRLTREVKDHYPDLVIVGTGYSWLRQYVPYVAAATVRQGWTSIVGLGRGAFAYPDFAKDILRQGKMDPLKVCVSCSSCTQIMRDHGRAGCVIRDSDVYTDIYMEGRWHDPVVIQQEASRCLECIDATCAAHCPAGIDIPEFLKSVKNGRDEEAYRILRRANLLPEICGYVCPVEVQCQGHCIQPCVGKEAVPVANIQKFIAGKARREHWTALRIPNFITGKRIAIIGAGPAGLSCAAELLEQGHEVTIIERGSRAGGKADSVIPCNRLPVEETKEEIRSIFQPISTDRLEWRFNTALSPRYTITDVKNEGFDAVLLAFGLGNTSSLIADQPKPEGVIDALAFLDQMKRNPAHRVMGKIAVIGGGNTAIDAAVVAKSCGAEDVYLIYRRSFSEMPAWPKERERALKSGIHFLLLLQPTGYEVNEHGYVTAVNVIRTELGQPDSSGRRSPVVIPGTDHKVPATMVIEAIGETLSPETRTVLGEVEIDRKGLVQIDPITFMTSQPGIFAAGDLVNGGTTVVQAIAEGKKAAQRIHLFLQTESIAGPARP